MVRLHAANCSFLRQSRVLPDMHMCMSRRLRLPCVDFVWQIVIDEHRPQHRVMEAYASHTHCANAKLLGVVHSQWYNMSVLIQWTLLIDIALCQISYYMQFLWLQSQCLAALEPGRDILCRHKPVQVMRCTSFAALHLFHLLYRCGRNSMYLGSWLKQMTWACTEK